MSTANSEKTGPNATVDIAGLRNFIRDNKLGDPDDLRSENISFGHSNEVHLIHFQGKSWALAPSSARTSAADRARRDPRVSCAQGSPGHRRAGPASVCRVRRSEIHRRAFLPDGVYAWRGHPRRREKFRQHARASARGERRHDRFAGRAAGGRLARRRPRRLRASRRISSAPAQAMGRSTRAHASAHAPAAGDESGARLAAGAYSRVAARDHRAWRLQARQRDVESDRSAQSRSRCSIGRCRPSAIRSPISAGC